MDEVTKQVKEMYELYPFPSTNIINEAHGNRIMRDLKARGIKCSNLKILDAGCGSGEKAISFAKVFRDSEVYGWDICENSIKIAKEMAEKEKINNVKFMNMDLLNVDTKNFGDYFDLIISWGVIHHLSDSAKGMKNLGLCLKPQGLMYIWVYALHSLERVEIGLFREVVRTLLKKEGFSYEKGIKIAHGIKGLFRTLNFTGKKDLLMRFKWFLDKDVNKKQIILHMLKNFRKIKYTTDYDVNIVDSFLHANEKDYDVEMIFRETREAGLEVVDLPDLSSKIEDIVKSDYVKELFYSLDLEDRLKIMERLTNIGHHLFIVKRK